MNTDNRKAEFAPLEVIRVETALSRYPVHRLAKQGIISIELREENAKGEATLKWEVSHNSKYGQPGPLAYKLDTLIVNRRIEEATRPIPRIVRLGSLAAIAREIGAASHNTTHTIKRALYQNASAFITAKIGYRANDGTERTLEAGFTRYNVIFTGEKLPDGRTADAVYLLLSDPYMQVINGAQTRPLDYDYLKELCPAAQRWYELASYAMYAALKNGRPSARLAYSEFCMYAPQVRNIDFAGVKKQMHKVHAPHREAGYIAGVEYEATTDREGRPDWLMHYEPGPKAKAEFRRFTTRGGPAAIEVEAAAPGPDPGPTGPEQELVSRGVTRGVAAELLREFSADHIRSKIEHVDWLRAKEPERVADVGAYLGGASRGDYRAPHGFRSKAERQQLEQVKREQLRREAEARLVKAREREEQARVDAYWAGLTPAGRAQIEADALSCADTTTREGYEQATLPALKRVQLKFIREAHIRGLLGLPAAR